MKFVLKLTFCLFLLLAMPAIASVDEAKSDCGINGFSPDSSFHSRDSILALSWGIDITFEWSTLMPAAPREDWFVYPCLTEEILEQMINWRDENGLPWSVWVYEEEHSFRSLYEYVIRHRLAENLFHAYDQIEFELALYNLAFPEDQIELMEENKRQAFNQFLHWKYNPIENLEVYKEGTRQWLHKNIPITSKRDIYSDRELFAWYTSPGYVKGSLPASVEKVFETVLNRSEAEFLKLFGEGYGYPPEHFLNFVKIRGKMMEGKPLVTLEEGEPLLAPLIVIHFLVENNLSPLQDIEEPESIIFH